MGPVAGWALPVQHRKQLAQSAQPGRECQLHRMHRARERSRHCRRQGGDCRGPSAPKVPPDLRAQVQVRHEGNGAGYSVDERAGFCGTSTLGVWSVGKALHRKIYAVEVRIKHLESSFNGWPRPGLRAGHSWEILNECPGLVAFELTFTFREMTARAAYLLRRIPTNV